MRFLYCGGLRSRTLCWSPRCHGDMRGLLRRMIRRLLRWIFRRRRSRMRGWMLGGSFGRRFRHWRVNAFFGAFSPCRGFIRRVTPFIFKVATKNAASIVSAAVVGLAIVFHWEMTAMTATVVLTSVFDGFFAMRIVNTFTGTIKIIAIVLATYYICECLWHEGMCVRGTGS